MKATVYSSDGSQIAELVGCVKSIDPQAKVSCVAIGKRELAERGAMFADEVLFAELPAATAAESLFALVAERVVQDGFDLFLVGSTSYDLVLAGTVAAKTGTSAVVGVKTLAKEGNGFVATHIVYGGGAVREESSQGGMVVSAMPGISEPAAERGQSCEIMNIDFGAVPGGIRLVEDNEKPAVGAGVASAKRVVGVGRAFASVEDIELAKQLAAALDAAVGYTRPVTETDPPLAEGEPYIGVSGLQINPDLYFAIGVSGQTQHIIGVNDSKLVVCVNNDPNALIFKRSDYGIVADFHEAIPALIGALGK